MNTARPTNATRIAILFSGRGTNLQVLARHIARPNVPAELVLTISNRPDASGIAFCRDANIACLVVDHKVHATRNAFEAAMQKALDEARVELICCAGFMRLLTGEFVTHWHDRLLNIHPSLLPAYRGLDTHARALADGATQHGCTVHYMRPEMDDGPILVQKSIDVLLGDTLGQLAARVLEQEHIAYVEALDKVLATL